MWMMTRQASSVKSVRPNLPIKQHLVEVLPLPHVHPAARNQPRARPVHLDWKPVEHGANAGTYAASPIAPAKPQNCVSDERMVFGRVLLAPPTFSARHRGAPPAHRNPNQPAVL